MTLATLANLKPIRLLGFSNGNTGYQDAKRAIDKEWQHTERLSEAQIKDCIKRGHWIGGVIPEGFILIDIDSKESGKTVYEGLLKSGYSFICIETPHGYQFIFKDTGRVKNQGAKRLTLGSIVVDYRLAGKGYIVLPTPNTAGRQVIHTTERDLAPMPLLFIPVRGFKETDTMAGTIFEGGRDSTLISHACKLREWNIAHNLNLTYEEKGQALSEVNQVFCYPPLPQNDIDRILKSADRYPVISEQRVTNVTDVTFDDNKLISISRFPFEVFPDRLLSVIYELSDALHVEPELIASSMLTIISGAIGNTIRISPKKGYEVAPFLWLIIIALSGYGKSPVIQALLKYIKLLQAKDYQKYQTELKEYERALKKSKKDEDFDIPDKPKLRHRLVSDCTVESLADVFENDGRGVISYQDEIAGLMLGLDQYKGKGNDRQHYLELYNCDSWKIDRRSGVRFVHNTGAAIIGGIQPKVMPKIFKADAFEDGLLPRFLLLNAENGSMKFSRQSITDDALSCWTSLINWCYRLPLTCDDLGFIQPKVLILSSEALTEYEHFYNDYGNRMPFLSEKAKVFIPKLTPYYCLKFAGVLQAITAFDKGAALGSLIDAETIKNAIGLTKFFAGQVIKTLRHYEGDSLTEYQKRLVNVLYDLQGETTGGKLPLSRIVDTFNKGLPEVVKHTPEKIQKMLSGELGLQTEKSNHNLSFLQWEAEKIQKIFSRTTVTSVTPKAIATHQKVTEVTDVTVNPENEVIDFTGVDFEVVE